MENLIFAAGLLNSVAKIIMNFYMQGEEPTTPETPAEEETKKEGE